MELLLALLSFVLGVSVVLAYQSIKRVMSPVRSTIPEGYRRLSVNIPFDVHFQLKNIAEEHGTTMTGIMINLVRQYINNYMINRYSN